MRTWWHVHEWASYRCHGGSTDRDIAADLLEINAEDGLAVRLVESKDDPDDCYYRDPRWVVLHGVVLSTS